PDALHREAGDDALAEGLLAALLDGRDEALRDDPALDRVLELEPGAVAGEGLDLDLAVPELAPAAGLLLLAPVSLGRPAACRLVGHRRRLERHVGPEAGLEAVDDDLDVDLREPGDDLVAGLRIAVQVDRRVLLLQAAQRAEDLVLVALGLRLDGE